jgi:hypothetical protein
MVNWKDVEGNGLAYFKIFFRHLTGSTEDSFEKFPWNR